MEIEGGAMHVFNQILTKTDKVKIILQFKKINMDITGIVLLFYEADTSHSL